jgi:hypothetical protein
MPSYTVVSFSATVERFYATVEDMHNAINKSTWIFKCPCIVVWYGNLPTPFILPPPFRILNGGG